MKEAEQGYTALPQFVDERRIPAVNKESVTHRLEGR
jgi:hypothetical protein